MDFLKEIHIPFIAYDYLTPIIHRKEIEMSMVLIGSRAIIQNSSIPFYRNVERSDWDFLAHKESFIKWYNNNNPFIKECIFKQNPDRFLVTLENDTHICFDVDACKSNLYLLELNPSKLAQDYNVSYRTATIFELLAIKRSHLISETNWHKHIKDYYWIINNLVKNRRFDYNYFTIFALRQEEVKNRNPSKLNLNKSNEEFFSDNVKRKYPHDYLHQLVAYYDKPLHEKLKKDKSKAYISWEEFKQLDKEYQLKMAWEEIYVIALERFIIPETHSNKKAYDNALCLCSTRLSKGKYRDFLIDNYETLKEPDIDFVKLFKQNLSKESEHVQPVI